MTNEKRALICFALFILDLFLYHTLLAQTDPAFTQDGAIVRLAWDANPEPDVAYYTAYWYRADSAGVLGTVQHPDTTAVFALPMRRMFERYSFSLTATDLAGNESAHSATVAGIFSREPVLYGDVNADNMVDIEDAELTRMSLGARPFYVMWRDERDLNGDEVIDIEDVEIIRSRYGRR